MPDGSEAEVAAKLRAAMEQATAALEQFGVRFVVITAAVDDDHLQVAIGHDYRVTSLGSEWLHLLLLGQAQDLFHTRMREARLGPDEEIN